LRRWLLASNETNCEERYTFHVDRVSAEGFFGVRSIYDSCVLERVANVKHGVERQVEGGLAGNIAWSDE
jgi:hypothetical protein